MDISYLYYPDANWKDHMQGKTNKEVIACGAGWNQWKAFPAMSQNTAHLITSKLSLRRERQERIGKAQGLLSNLPLQLKPGLQT